VFYLAIVWFDCSLYFVVFYIPRPALLDVGLVSTWSIYWLIDNGGPLMMMMMMLLMMHLTHYWQIVNYYYYHYYYALILHYQGLKISRSKNVCPEWLRWGLGNCERVGKAHCVETLNCHWNTLVQERSFPWIGCAKRGSSADFCYEAVSLVWQGTKSLYRHQKKHVSGSIIIIICFC